MKRFSLLSLLIFVTLIASGLGLYQAFATKPVTYPVHAVLKSGERVDAWVYAVPWSGAYKASKWSQNKFEGVQEVDPFNAYYVWYHMELLPGEGGEPAMILHLNSNMVVKVR
jgi:hypothetical protein